MSFLKEYSNRYCLLGFKMVLWYLFPKSLATEIPSLYSMTHLKLNPSLIRTLLMLETSNEIFARHSLLMITPQALAVAKQQGNCGWCSILQQTM